MAKTLNVRAAVIGTHSWEAPKAGGSSYSALSVGLCHPTSSPRGLLCDSISVSSHLFVCILNCEGRERKGFSILLF